MILKNPTPASEFQPVILETATFLVAAFFPAARVPVLVLQGLKVLTVWASSSQHSGNRSLPNSTASP